MLKSIKKPTEDIFSIQQNAEENQDKHNSSELIHREPIDNSPLWIVGNKDLGYFISIREYRITEHYNTIEEAREALEKEKWNIITRLVGILLEIIQNERNKEIDQERAENTHQENG